MANLGKSSSQIARNADFKIPRSRFMGESTQCVGNYLGEKIILRKTARTL
jgi:hypothetical protein